ncbi:MAG: hypothetical protein RL131_1072 [Bacteroidota bacterium]|jgi:hypothetical protein
MKFSSAILVTGLLAYALGLFLPWWTISIAGLLSGYFIHQNRFLSFLAGFLAIALLWGGMAYWMSTANEHILSRKMSMLILKKDSALLMVVLTSLVGGLVSGISSLTGSSLAWIVKKQ